MTTLENNNIEIAILEVGPQEKAILAFYFDSVGKDLFSIVDEDKAVALIVDYDIGKAKKRVRKLLKTTDSTVVILSDKDPKISSTVWIAKPLTAIGLADAANSIHQLLEKKDTKSAETVASDENEISSNTDSNTENSNNKEVNQLSDEVGNLEFNEILNANQNSDSEGESEIDALLDSLLEENNEQINQDSNTTLNEETDDDAENIFRENLALDEELEDKQNDNKQTLEATKQVEPAKDKLSDTADAFDSLVESDESITEEQQSTDSKFENINIDNIDSDTVLNEDELLEKSIPLEEDENLVITDKESILLDENITRHVDDTLATETVYAETLIVNYDEIKAESKENTIAEIEKVSTKTQEISLDKDNNSKQDLEFETSFSAPEKPEISLNPTGSTTAELANLEDDLATDLDSLLNEVSVETENFIPQVPNNEENSEDNGEKRKENPTTEDDSIDQEVKSESDNPSDSDLQSLLNEVREEATKDHDDELDLDADGLSEKTATKKRWIQLCGKQVNIKKKREVAKSSFNEEQHFLGEVIKLIKSKSGTKQLYQLKYYDLIIVLDIPKDRIYCNLLLTDDDYSEVCFNQIDIKKITIYDLDYSEVRLYQSKLSKQPENFHSIESFLWSTSLLTSRGRLPENTELNKPIGLKDWPNLTRLELPPHAIQIAALLYKYSGTLLEISKWLNIEQRYVFAFYNAALHIDMIEMDSSKLKKSAANSSNNISTKNSKENGFFSGLFKKIKI